MISSRTFVTWTIWVSLFGITLVLQDQTAANAISSENSKGNKMDESFPMLHQQLEPDCANILNYKEEPLDLNNLPTAEGPVAESLRRIVRSPGAGCKIGLVAGSVVGGAAVGAAIGTAIVPVVGSLIGGLVGVIGGVLGGHLGAQEVC